MCETHCASIEDDVNPPQIRLSSGTYNELLMMMMLVEDFNIQNFLT